MSDFFPIPTPDDRQKNHQRLRDLCALLAGCLENNTTGPAAFSEQTPILNALFHTIIAEKLDLQSADGAGDQAAQGWLRLALQVQRQCMDTVKAESTAQYLQTLNTLNATRHMKNPFLGIAPPPHENGETK